MNTFRIFLFVLLAAGLASAAQGGESTVAPAETVVSTLDAVEAKILDLTNAERADHGIPPLIVERGILSSARSHAAWMAGRQSMTHSGGPYCENIAYGQPTPEAVVTAWMNSPGHRANMLRQSVRAIGVGAARAASGAIYWCWQATAGDGNVDAYAAPNGSASINRCGHRRWR